MESVVSLIHSVIQRSFFEPGISRPTPAVSTMDVGLASVPGRTGRITNGSICDVIRKSCDSRVTSSLTRPIKLHLALNVRYFLSPDIFSKSSFWSMYSNIWGAFIKMPTVPPIVTAKKMYNCSLSITIAI